jgi:hypothetical protein
LNKVIRQCTQDDTAAHDTHECRIPSIVLETLYEVVFQQIIPMRETFKKCMIDFTEYKDHLPLDPEN